VPARIVRLLAERDIHTPFPVQAGVLRDALAGRDVLAKAPTGSGKTLAFAIPIVEGSGSGGRKPSAVVLVPTRELASQVAVEITSLAPAASEVATVYGGVPLGAQIKRARTADVLVATPGRLNDLLERKAVSLKPSPSSFSTRPTGCSTWASSRRSTGSSATFHAADRRCSSPRLSTRR
jgi:superfamily II DNA/RNA helicase